MLTAINNDPPVLPTPLIQRSGVWAGIAALLTVILQITQVVQFPPPWDKWSVVIGVFAGFLLHTFFGPPSYKPTPPPDPMQVEINELRAQLAAQLKPPAEAPHA